MKRDKTKPIIVSVAFNGKVQWKKYVTKEELHEQIDEIIEGFDNEMYVVYIRKNENEEEMNKRLKND